MARGRIFKAQKLDHFLTFFAIFDVFWAIFFGRFSKKWISDPPMTRKMDFLASFTTFNSFYAILAPFYHISDRQKLKNLGIGAQISLSARFRALRAIFAIFAMSQNWSQSHENT